VEGKMKFVGLSGSIRKESFNTKLLNFIKNHYHDQFELEILNIEDLPYFNQDDELDPSDVVKAFKQKVKDADGILIATPEYNWSVPGVLKNALDWLSRVDKVMTNKPVMIVGATPGKMGTIRAQIDLRRILSSPGLDARVLPPAVNEFLLIAAHEKFDSEGHLIDESTVQFLDNVVSNFIGFVKENQ
jgi:chromate reductase, NAD(P)H dehydrogenase (quinone)